MRVRALSAVLALAAVVLYVAAVRPLRLRVAEAADVYRVAREQRHDKRVELQDRERRESTVRQAMAAVSAPPRPAGETVLRVRRTIVQALDSTQVRAARLSVRPGRAPAGAAAVRVTASGPVENVLRLTAQLSEPGRGVVLESVGLGRESGGLSLELVALGFPGSKR